MNHPLEQLADDASAAHFRIQQDFARLDPVVWVSRPMRAHGVPADLITIDCLQSGKRIILILHDQPPGLLSYQCSRRDADTPGGFETMAVVVK